MTVVLWFKRDLRITDHAALAWAAGQGRAVVPLYVVEPEYWQLPDTSARQWDFTAECLSSLDTDLTRLGAPLIVRNGPVISVLEDLHAQLGAFDMISHEETGNLWTYKRDLAVGDWMRARGLAWREVPQTGVVRRLHGRDGWAGLRNRFVAQPQIEAPLAVRPTNLQSEKRPTAKEFNMTPDACPARQMGGRGEALSLLGGFLTERGQDYRAAMSSPLAGEWACSRVSPHLALGALSMREAVHAAQARAVEVKGTRVGWAGSVKSFQSRLAWRDHFVQKLEDEPRIETHCLHPAYENLRPKESDASRLQAWQTGQTGLPFLDACMRYLSHTGWLNFRMRSMVQAVASYHLWLDWRPTGHHLARMFTDYEPGIHWSQVQMQSGTTGINTIRIYNPIKQGSDQDPDGIFTRRWVPELNAVPDMYLQEPWLWPEAGSLLGRTYPNPIIDVKAAAKEARDAVWAVRKGEAFGTKSREIVHKHASRKDSSGHFVDDRAPKKAKSRAKAKSPSTQTSFEF
jgi:deoxyribodipyrimidine photo-lyase